MKKTLSTIALLATALMLTDCGHNIAQWGAGSSFRLGSGEFSLSYTDGLFLNSVNRENTIITAEIDSTVGASYDPVTGTFKGIKGITMETGPQLTGYTVDAAKQSPEAVSAYYDALKAYYESKAGKPAQPLISDEKSKSATKSVTDILKTALAAARDIVDGKEEAEGKDSVFVCDGDCEYADLTGNADIGWQLSIATKLLEYDGEQGRFPDTGENYKTTLEHFIAEILFYKGRGHKNTPLRVKYVTVENKTIVKLMYAYVKRDGTSTDVECPSCVAMLDDDAD
jgi:hypothetical protein